MKYALAACLIALCSAAQAQQALKPSGSLPPGLPFSEGIQVGNLVLLSGQVGVKPGKMELNNATPEIEFKQTMDNIKAVLEANGMTMKNVVKCTVMLTDMKLWGDFNNVYKTYFSEPYPARSAFGASALALGARVEVECLAAR